MRALSPIQTCLPFVQIHAERKTAQEPHGMKMTLEHPEEPGVGRVVYPQKSSSTLALLLVYMTSKHQSAVQKIHDRDRGQMDQAAAVALLSNF